MGCTSSMHKASLEAQAMPGHDKLSRRAKTNQKDQSTGTNISDTTKFKDISSTSTIAALITSVHSENAEKRAVTTNKIIEDHELVTDAIQQNKKQQPTKEFQNKELARIDDDNNVVMEDPDDIQDKKYVILETHNNTFEHLENSTSIQSVVSEIDDSLNQVNEQLEPYSRKGNEIESKTEVNILETKSKQTAVPEVIKSNEKPDTLKTIQGTDSNNDEANTSYILPAIKLFKPDESPGLDEYSSHNTIIDTLQDRDNAFKKDMQTDLCNESEDNKTTRGITPPPVESNALSMEDSESVGQAVIKIVEERIASLKDIEWIKDDGTIPDEVYLILNVLDQSYRVLKSANALHECVVATRQNIARIILESGIATQICNLDIVLCEVVPVTKFSGANSRLHYPVHISMHILGNFSDTSEELAEKIANVPGFLQLLHSIHKDSFETKLKQDTSVSGEDQCGCVPCVISCSLTLIHNISAVESNIPLLRQYNFIDVLKPYLKSRDRNDHLAALASLAAIVDEKESEIINSNKKVVKRLMKFLRRGLRTVERRFQGWSCKELATTIRTLARNDANKKLLVQLGALRLLVKLAKGNLEEQIEALGAIWALSFDDDNRKVMIDEKLGIVKTLSDLKDSECDKIKTAANGALWNLRDNLRLSNDETYRGIERKLSGGIQKAVTKMNTDVDESKGHIFISYQWSNQRTLIDVRNELHKQGFKVWMDVDNMAGSTLQAMAEAVENADIVLICFSPKYKNSPNCRAEAEYTFLRQKNIIPLRMEADYKPDGWLGILIGTKLFYDFSGKYDFNDKVDKLIKEVAGLKKQMDSDVRSGNLRRRMEPIYHSVDIVDAPVVQYIPDVFKPSSATDRVRKWSADDLQIWKRKYDLPEKECGCMTCDEIVLLIKMMKEAPESFYKGLQRKFNYDTRVISQLVKALEDIQK